MKKLLMTLGISSVLLIGCSGGSVTEAIDNGEGNRFTGLNAKITIITDTETGCKYIYTKEGLNNTNTNSMSPLMKNKDEVDCGQ